MSAQAALAAIRPTKRELVYDLVRAVGLNVDDWSNYKKGKTAPAANPRYCYEWSFTQDDQYVVLNLWHASFMPHGDVLACDLNMRQYQMEIERVRHEPWRDNKPKAVWATRATKMDAAIQLAVRKKLPIRVIVCEGTMRDFAAGDEKASKVKNRTLDPEAWQVESYDPETGATRLVRGSRNAAANSSTENSDLPLVATAETESAGLEPPDVESEIYVDQFSDELDGPGRLPDRTLVQTTVLSRDRGVRMQALRRAKGHCQLCGAPGFKTAAGQTYLETHHVQPLSEGGVDEIWNVVALCATDHRRAHFSAERDAVRLKLLALLKPVAEF